MLLRSSFLNMTPRRFNYFKDFLAPFLYINLVIFFWHFDRPFLRIFVGKLCPYEQIKEQLDV